MKTEAELYSIVAEVYWKTEHGECKGAIAMLQKLQQDAAQEIVELWALNPSDYGRVAELVKQDGTQSGSNPEDAAKIAGSNPATSTINELRALVKEIYDWTDYKQTVWAKRAKKALKL